MLLAKSVLLLWALRSGGLRFKCLPIRVTLLAGALIALYQFMSFSAMAEIGVAVDIIVAMGSAPVFAGILEYFVKSKKPVSR